MRRLGLRIMLMLLLIVFGIFYGVDLATKGTERIHGTFDDTEVAETSTDVPAAPDANDEEERSADTLPNLSDASREVTQSKLPLWIGNALQSIAQKGIEWVVSIFDWFAFKQ